ncbi:MAG TPA: endolytic transglycosylase MltG [Candidatus Kapabacteria bacterium]|nr:endolytic transglycosylase MltG [Candidatus Kapabacteria bacterium]
MSRRSLSLLVVIALALCAVYYIFFLKNPKISEREVVISIPPGMTVASLSDTLAAHDLLRSRLAFQLAARTLGAAKKLHAGLYRIAPGLSNSEIIRRVTGSEYALILRATFPEGITIYRAASIAHDKLGLDSGIFMRFAFDTGFLHSLGIPRDVKSAEGYLFPDTYEFLLSADPKGLIIRMVRRWKTIALDSLFDQSDESGLSLPEVMTLASIVEAEAKRPEERDTIASVYLNRLKIGMALDADPTVQYGLHLSRPITHDDLEIPNSYNTYRHPGLPPGPICNPGAASIRAVLHPAASKYLYFVARRDGSGGHYFSRTLAEQERMINLAKANTLSEP